MGSRRPWTDVDQSRATCNALDRYNTELRYDEEGPEDRADCWRCPVCKDRVSPVDGYACSCLYHAQAQLIEELRGLFANRKDRAVQDLCIEEERAREL